MSGNVDSECSQIWHTFKGVPNWKWSSRLCVFPNYRGLMKITSTLADLLISNILKWEVPPVNLGLYEKRSPLAWAKAIHWKPSSCCMVGSNFISARPPDQSVGTLRCLFPTLESPVLHNLTQLTLQTFPFWSCCWFLTWLLQFGIRHLPSKPGSTLGCSLSEHPSPWSWGSRSLSNLITPPNTLINAPLTATSVSHSSLQK